MTLFHVKLDLIFSECLLNGLISTTPSFKQDCGFVGSCLKVRCVFRGLTLKSLSE